jgi:hypothetical protein
MGWNGKTVAAGPLAEVMRLALLGMAPLGALEAMLDRMEATP